MKLAAAFLAGAVLFLTGIVVAEWNSGSRPPGAIAIQTTQPHRSPAPPPVTHRPHHRRHTGGGGGVVTPPPEPVPVPVERPTVLTHHSHRSRSTPPVGTSPGSGGPGSGHVSGGTKIVRKGVKQHAGHPTADQNAFDALGQTLREHSNLDEHATLHEHGNSHERGGPRGRGRSDDHGKSDGGGESDGHDARTKEKSRDSYGHGHGHGHDGNGNGDERGQGD